MSFTLPISPAYVSHWGIWEAIRELYQNALDAQVEDSANVASIKYDEATHRLIISSTKGKLTPASLVLGNTSKAGDVNQRGKFGEGYKLALLVLARKNIVVEITNGDESWSPVIEHDETFDSDVLKIHVDQLPSSHPGIEFIVYGVLPEAWRRIEKNIYMGQYNVILDDEPGRVYVGGLFVANVKEFKCGYSFGPNTIKLDRDRGMVDGFDLSYETSRLHTRRGGAQTLALLDQEAPDVRYVSTHAQPTSTIVTDVSSHYFSRYGLHTVPVSTQEEIQEAQQAGLSWALVKEGVKSLLHMAHKWIIPSSDSPVARLRKFYTKYQYSMNADMKSDLMEIIEAMDPQPVAEL
jgi:hypothetical protein